MLNHTKKVKQIYEDIQRRIFYMIPEKWEKLYLYSSFIDNKDDNKNDKNNKDEIYYNDNKENNDNKDSQDNKNTQIRKFNNYQANIIKDNKKNNKEDNEKYDEENNKQEQKKGELYFYYIPKGIFKKRPINVYEIPTRFNLDENQYLRLVQHLYDKIKELREEFRKSETGDLWTNITMMIENTKFKVEYNYDNLEKSDFTSYERHVIWRYNYLDIGPEQVSKEEREILKKYLLGAKTLDRKETYETGIYISEIENVIDYTTENYNTENEKEEKQEKPKRKNQILMNEKDIE